MTAREEFLAGERLDDVLVYLRRDAVGNPDALTEHAEEVPGGLVLVLPGEEARSVFQRAAGIDPMAFAREAGATEGEVESGLTGATCPESEDDKPGADEDGRAGGEDWTGDEGGADGDGGAGGDGGSGGNSHDVRFIFAFAEGENPDAGGLYAEGDVIHAYVSCSCGAAYSDRWVVGEE